MLLLTFRNWNGPTASGRQKADMRGVKIERDIREVGLVTRLALGEAIRRVHEYEIAHTAHFDGDFASEYELLQVSVIDDLDDAEIRMARVTLVESLPRSKADFD